MKAEKIKDIAAVVVTYNRKDLLLQCIQALINQSYPLKRVYIVSNGSTDGTYDFLKEHQIFDNSLIEWYDLGENLGGAGGFHYGIKKAFENQHDWIWSMDDDTIPLPNALEELILFVENNPDKNIGTLLSLQITWQQSSLHYRLPKTVYEAFKYYIACPIKSAIDENKAINIDWFPFVSFLMPRKVINEIGFPRKDIFIYGDDQDYAFRVGEKGYQMFLITPSKVDHLSGRKVDIKQKMVSDWRWYYTYRNQIAVIKLHRKHIGKLLGSIALFRISMGGVKRILATLVVGKWSISNYVFRGFIHGHMLKMGKTVTPK